jgi:hypothetical protein
MFRKFVIHKMLQAIAPCEMIPRGHKPVFSIPLLAEFLYNAAIVAFCVSGHRVANSD